MFPTKIEKSPVSVVRIHELSNEVVCHELSNEVAAAVVPKPSELINQVLAEGNVGPLLPLEVSQGVPKEVEKENGEYDDCPKEHYGLEGGTHEGLHGVRCDASHPSVNLRHDCYGGVVQCHLQIMFQDYY